ncbi:MAG: aminotransferase class I/II-fold pyridoxal phosphate-dependent enzyme [Clostridia bacterium]|nr:aminotransferase class I/II-fold pyridoxal phosphate-dependent enzyme [Clostridia bacterium]
MLSFASDYIEGAHPAILQRLIDTNFEKLSGYGDDRYTESAKEKIKAACGCPGADVWFLVGGTQTNQVIISSLLEANEGVVAADTGHVSLHEAGAIEVTGHKVMNVPGHEGKIWASDLKKMLETYYGDDFHEHMVAPGMVYLSHPTEYGTLYTKAELTAIRDVCRAYDMPLFLDGARLGYGLMTPGTDVTLPDIAELCDVFYIGGTKVGALCGEAVVFTKNNTPKHFLARIKQRGALMAKGRVLGVQFDTLFTDGLYFEIAKHAIDMSVILRGVFREKGYSFSINSPTNQIFVILDDAKAAELSENVVLNFWERLDASRCVYRFATSWATRKEDIDALAELL